MKTVKYFILIFLCFFLQRCEQFDYSVYQTDDFKKYPQVTNAYNIQRVLSMPNKDTLHLVFTGDTQRFYDDVKDLVSTVNNLPKVDAVVITGDLADFGVAREYDWLNEELIKLKVPFFTVIGNHDCLANGSEIYQQIYGPLNYSFTWNKIRFIMHNTNGREYYFNGSVPDIQWMQANLSDTQNYESCIFVSHVPPTNEDFDPQLRDPYTMIIREAKNTIFSSNGHRHGYELAQPFNDNVWYLNTSSPVNRVYSYVTVYPNATKGKKFNCIPVYF
jgi:3',5'-cyclic-AMP phosphodiesterase